MTDEEHVPRNPSVCKKCEFKKTYDRRPHCDFWGLWLTEVKWCNK